MSHYVTQDNIYKELLVASDIFFASPFSCKTRSPEQKGICEVWCVDALRSSFAFTSEVARRNRKRTSRQKKYSGHREKNCTRVLSRKQMETVKVRMCACASTKNVITVGNEITTSDAGCVKWKPDNVLLKDSVLRPWNQIEEIVC